MNYYSPDEALALAVVDALKTRSETLAVCESLTAGMAAATLASIPGASAVLRGGLITYATDLKVHLARVPQEVIDTHTVVSTEVAEAMAIGAREQCGSDWGLSLTGVAGPTQQDGHPVGTVFLGIAFPNGTAHAFQLDARVLQGDRNTVRKAAVDLGLESLHSEIVKYQGIGIRMSK